MTRRGTGDWQDNRFAGWSREEMRRHARKRIMESDRLARYPSGEHWGRLLGAAWRHCERILTEKEEAA